MKDKVQFECLDEHCRTVVIGHGCRMDGISCPRCDGPVIARPFKPQKKVSEDALYVRGKIIEHCHKHCFDLTPEQVETVIEIYKSQKLNKMTVKVEATGLDKVKEVFQVLKDTAANERVPIEVREEIMDKLNTILESRNDE